MNDKNEMSEKLREEHNEIVKQGRLELVIECPECHKHDVLILDHRIVEKTSVCASCGSDFIVPMFSQVHADAFAAKAVREEADWFEDVCRKQGHLYFNAKGTGRRLFWGEGGWELESHRNDKDGFYFDTVREAFAAVDDQGEPKEAE